MLNLTSSLIIFIFWYLKFLDPWNIFKLSYSTGVILVDYLKKEVLKLVMNWYMYIAAPVMFVHMRFNLGKKHAISEKYVSVLQEPTCILIQQNIYFFVITMGMTACLSGTWTDIDIHIQKFNYEAHWFLLQFLLMINFVTNSSNSFR